LDLDAVGRCLGGDRDAFEHLVRRWQDRIYGAIFRMVRDRETAADLAQETFLKAWSRLSSFEGGSAFGTWLYSIALNQVRSEMRRRSALKNRPPLSLEALGRGGDGQGDGSDYDPADDRPDAAQSLSTREECGLLLDAVAALDDDFREVIVLREFQDLSYDEIAVSVGVPVGTVRSRLHRARADLRDRLKDRVLR
jgi:RNA polymerase sigma-70 factor (ECF subfamily)